MEAAYCCRKLEKAIRYLTAPRLLSEPRPVTGDGLTPPSRLTPKDLSSEKPIPALPEVSCGGAVGWVAEIFFPVRKGENAGV